MEKNIKLEIKKWGINGEGIGYHNHKPVFISGAIPGEFVEVKIEENKERYMIGKLVEVKEEASARRYPFCSLWQSCGGCSLMHVRYKNQCKMKEQAVKEALVKYAGYKGKVEPIIKNPDPLNYRNSCKLPIRNGKTGMYVKNSRKFIEIERCYIHAKILEKTRQEVVEIFEEFDTSHFKTLVMKEYDEKIQMILVTEVGSIDAELIKKLSQLENVVSIWQSIKMDESIDVFGKTMIHLYGDKTMTLSLNDIQCMILPRSFFQLNTKQAIRLYEIVNEFTPQSNLIVEAYSGIGAISLFVHDKAKEVIGIESILDAVNNANENAKINHCDNVRFICGDAAEQFKKIKKPIDTLIVDPPRKGLSTDMKNSILDSNIETLIYVSCNPSTLAKDIKVLKKKYKIQKVLQVSQSPLG